MTHEPMNTAPRDGREVWLMLKNQNRMELRSWDEDRKQWRNYDLEYSDCYFSGWLDIEALVRDAERLDFIEKQCVPQMAVPQFWRNRNGLISFAAYDEAKCSEAETVRAAIDKEINITEREQRHAAKRDEIARRT